MRSLLAALAAPTLATATSNAGTPAQPVLLPVSHHVGTRAHRPVDRAFIVLPGLAPRDVGWRGLDMETYDPTQIADAPALAQPRKFTLLGPDGVHTIATSAHVYLDDKLSGKKTAALEVDGTGAAIAIPGEWPDARWVEIGASRLGIAQDPTSHQWLLRRCYRFVELDGYPLGVVTVADQMYIVLAKEGTTSAMLVPPG
jgi:hypothetical protein